MRLRFYGSSFWRVDGARSQRASGRFNLEGPQSVDLVWVVVLRHGIVFAMTILELLGRAVVPTPRAFVQDLRAGDALPPANGYLA